MGSSLSQTSKSLCRDRSNSNGNINNHQSKESRNSKPKFASPENRVLPVVTNGPTRLRSTDNGNILQSGGTISGRKNIQPKDSENFTEFSRFLQKKSQTHQSSPQNVSFQTLFGHRKSHSDPDIIRKMMEENETEEDDDGRFETESNPNQRSIIALSPSKAKIKSRKKKKAPEPPQANTLPRTITGRNSSKFETQEINKFNSAYESTEAPRRPLPPIPLDEMPPPPPPPPPDYNRTITNREMLKSSGKNFQKNRRIVDKWKFCKPNGENFSEKRQRSKSLDRTDDIRLREKELNTDAERFDRNHSLRNLSHREDSASPQRENKNQNSKNTALHDAIIDAAKKRAERIARNRNLSFRSSMKLSYEIDTDDTGQIINNSVDGSLNERSPYKKGNVQSHTHSNINSTSHIQQDVCIKENEQISSNKNFEQRPDKLKGLFQCGGLELRARNQQNLQNSFIEHRISRSSENLDDFSKGQRHIFEKECSNHTAKHVKNENSYKQNYSSNNSLSHTNSNGDISLRDRKTDFTDRDSYHQSSLDSRSVIPYNSEHKGLPECTADHHRNENDENLRSHLAKKGYQQPIFMNSVDETNQQNFSYYKPDRQNPTIENNNNVSRSFSRVSAIRKRSQDNKKKNTPDYKSNISENFMKIPHDNSKHLDLGVLPLLPDDEQTKRNARLHGTIIPFLSNCTVSSSSISEDEMEINLQLRPTLPRRPIDIPRFSPTDVWKSINLDFFKSHQQRSDVSSENGEDIMEEKIHRINRPVAPRRLIHDRSGDSGISPDAGSPMFLNENLDSPLMTNTGLCSPNGIPNDEENNAWIPQHDLDDSDCGTDTSRENKFNAANESVQPKLAMPNFMFPSRSLPRSDSKNDVQDKDISDKEKPRCRDKRKKGVRGSETQHFNSLRNLKRVLGIKSKISPVDVNGLDSNWSLSRSLPNFENVNNIDDAKIENIVPDVSAMDPIRRSNSESRMMQQENIKSHSIQHTSYKNSEWRKSFPGQSSEGHVMYLPQYCSTTMPCQISSRNRGINHTEEAKASNENGDTERKLDCDSTDEKAKNKKKFSYQSTIRQLEKKKLEEQLAKEVEEKEKKREIEIEWMNIVEDEFRKQRIREKSDVKQKLRIYNLEANKESKFLGSCDPQYFMHETHDEMQTDKVYTNGFDSDVQRSSRVAYDLNRSNPQESAQNISAEESSHNAFQTPGAIQRLPETSNQRIENCMQEIDTAHQRTHVQRKFYREISAISKSFQQSNCQRQEEKMQQVQSITNDKSYSQNSDISHRVSQTIYTKKTITNGHVESNKREVLINRNFINEGDNRRDDGNVNDSYGVECNRTVNGSLHYEQNNFQRHKKLSETFENHQTDNHDQLTKYISNVNVKNSGAIKNVRKEQSHGRFPDSKEDDRFEKTESTYVDRIHQSYLPPFEDNIERNCKAKDNVVSYNTQQPTGMKKWLRRQNREHQRHENIPRPEPEGGRSSSDDCKQIDGKREIMNGRSQPIGANSPSQIKCNHGRGFHCSICNHHNRETAGFRKNGVDVNVSSVHPSTERFGRAEKARDDRPEVHPKVSKMNGNLENHLDIPEFVRDSTEGYELHTRLCRTSSGRTFESHSYYALERRREDSTENESSRKAHIPKEPQRNFFSSANFEKELKENVRKKSRDIEKRARKYHPCGDFDSDDSGSDNNEARYQRHNTRNLKKRLVSEHREPSFSRNHPHRNGARLKLQPNGHFNNGRSPSASKNSHPHTIQQKLPNSGL